MPYVPALDGIRGIAVLMVMAFHAGAPFASGGFIGVDVFFVLSGYLITHLLASEYQLNGRIDITRFYIRRARRLYPALLLMLTTYVAIGSFVFPGPNTHTRDAAIAALYLSDYARAFFDAPKVIHHTWSLAVEAHFYLAWPLLIGILMRSNRSAVWYLFALAVAAMAWRWGALAMGTSWSEVYYRFDTRLSGLLLGSVLGLWKPSVGSPRAVAVASLTSLIVLGFLHGWGEHMSLSLGVTGAELAAAGLVLTASNLALLCHAWIGWMGRLSYGAYLWHYPVMVWMREDWQWPVVLLVGGGAAFGLAAASFFFLERRFSRRSTIAHGAGKLD